MKNDNQPLVSVAVITYNSSKTVEETLDSIYNQTYPNLELIISDDCSTDNTVKICRDWIEVHKGRFVRTELLTAEKNTGVSANMNRGADACRGEWVKDIAGDDLLLPDCVQTYVDYVGEHPEAVYVFAKVETFGGEEDRRKEIGNQFLYDFFNWPIKQQYDFLTLERNCIPASTAFYNRERIIVLGIRNDERIPLLEDWPKWINLLKAGVHIDFVDKVTVRYRVGETGLSTQLDKPLIWRQQFALMELYYRLPYMKEINYSKRKMWRRRQYAKQVLEPKWYRSVALGSYERGAALYRLLTGKEID